MMLIKMVIKSPLNRIAEPDEVAHAVLASKASYINGINYQ